MKTAHAQYLYNKILRYTYKYVWMKLNASPCCSVSRDEPATQRKTSGNVLLAKQLLRRLQCLLSYTPMSSSWSLTWIKFLFPARTHSYLYVLFLRRGNGDKTKYTYNVHTRRIHYVDTRRYIQDVTLHFYFSF